uniref:Methylmalonyl-CoA mutase n=1 Tax=Candidatus Kentrum sp. FW TaxID=2126338 RepID=A0A450T459_9GAMM|nr:MAG: methylmalonyl-CoA mutase [Candidatus Kentron sp. FW]
MASHVKTQPYLHPWGGSYYVEALTNELIKRSWAHVQEVEELGGKQPRPSKPDLPRCASSMPPRVRRQRIDSGKETVVGRNKYRLTKEEPLEILDVDNAAVRRAQIERLNRVRTKRDEAKVRSALNGITDAAETGKGNLLERAVEAARARATLGEISDAMPYCLYSICNFFRFHYFRLVACHKGSLVKR